MVFPLIGLLAAGGALAAREPIQNYINAGRSRNRNRSLERGGGAGGGSEAEMANALFFGGDRYGAETQGFMDDAFAAQRQAQADQAAMDRTLAGQRVGLLNNQLNRDRFEWEKQQGIAGNFTPFNIGLTDPMDFGPGQDGAFAQPYAHLFNDPVMDAMATAFASVEGSGSYTQQGPIMQEGMYKGDRAYGKYQIMGANIPEWSKQVLGREMSIDEFLANPEAQEIIARSKFAEYSEGAANYEDVAAQWFGGKGQTAASMLNNAGDGYSTGAEYLGRWGEVFRATMAQQNTQLQTAAQMGVEAAQEQVFDLETQQEVRRIDDTINTAQEAITILEDPAFDTGGQFLAGPKNRAKVAAMNRVIEEYRQDYWTNVLGKTDAMGEADTKKYREMFPDVGSASLKDAAKRQILVDIFASRAAREAVNRDEYIASRQAQKALEAAKARQGRSGVANE